jgi:hypothetical protein
LDQLRLNIKVNRLTGRILLLSLQVTPSGRYCRLFNSARSRAVERIYLLFFFLLWCSFNFNC